MLRITDTERTKGVNAQPKLAQRIGVFNDIVPRSSDWNDEPVILKCAPLPEINDEADLQMIRQRHLKISYAGSSQF